MTEDEAKTKWCPFAAPVINDRLMIIPTGRTVTLDGDGRLDSLNRNCIGSACMAWRRDNPNGEFEVRFVNSERGETLPIDQGWEIFPSDDAGLVQWNQALSRWRRRIASGPTGHCGLAGQP